MFLDKSQAPQLIQTAVMQSVILPNELRFGIYLQEIGSDEIFQVDDAFFTLLELNLKCSIPIPLTEEWLLKLGFNKCEFNIPDKYKKEGCSFSIKYRKENGYTVEYKYGHVYLKYVHQLQNLFYSLIGRELTVA
jgi:hypothetical protein